MAIPVLTPLPRVQRPRRATPADAVRPTRAEINLGHLRHNLRIVRRFAGATRVWGVLKADGYGHGAPAVARTLERAGIDGICVALLEEAVELRNAGIHAPILVMGGNYGSGWGELLAHDLTPVIYDAGQVESPRSGGAPVRARACQRSTSRSTPAWPVSGCATTQSSPCWRSFVRCPRFV